MSDKAKHDKGYSPRRLMVFIAMLVVFVGLSVFGLVQNSRGAVERYNQLIATDQAGGDVEAALTELRQFMFSHMNTQIGGENGIHPPIQLRGTYERLVAAEQERVANATGNEELYNTAQAVCEDQISGGVSGRFRVECIEDYVLANGGEIIELRPIEDDLYKFDFQTPIWSADVAGFSLLFAAVSFVLVVWELIVRRLLKRAIATD